MGKTKILFLDIDGVLNSGEYYAVRERKIPKTPLERFVHDIDPVALNRLKSIVERTGCEIVISSSIRKVYKVVELRELFNACGYLPPILDKTPTSRDGFRGKEIRAWLDLGLFEDLKYCCVDDASDYFPDNNLFRTTWTKGLTDEVADSIVNFLNS